MEQNNIQDIATKVLKQIRNKIYLNHKSLSPAIYRMPVQFVEPGTGLFGTDAKQIYADPMIILKHYKKSANEFARVYLHMLFHCIYLHPFVTKYNVDEGMWNIALDICAEAAVLRMHSFTIDGDTERLNIINQMKQNIKMFIPELVYNELINAKYNTLSLVSLFHMDDHLWLEASQSNNNKENEDNEDNDYQNPNQKPQNNDSNNQQNDDSMSENQDSRDNSDGNSKSRNQNKSNKSDNSKNNRPKSNSTNNAAQKQEWSDVSRQIAADMQSFHQQGKDSGDTVQEIDYLTQDKMDYEEFLRQFSVIEEKMMINQDEFDYMYYTYGLNGMKNHDGKSIDKKVLLVEPLEYKEEKVIKDFVIAIDTSGSCSGELVKKFLNKTYSILKESESFSSRVNIHIVQCDARVQHDTKITNIDEIEYFMKNMKLYGFGGTDFRPVFQYVDELIKKKEFDNLCGLIYFTDGYGTYPKVPTPYKTAFAFLEDYNNRDDVPSWAMSVYWKDED